MVDANLMIKGGIPSNTKNQNEHARLHCLEKPRKKFLDVYKNIKRNKKGQFIKYGAK